MGTQLSEICNELIGSIAKPEDANVISLGCGSISATSFNFDPNARSEQYPLVLLVMMESNSDGDTFYKVAMFQNDDSEETAYNFNNVLYADEVIKTLNLPENTPSDETYLTPLTREMVSEVIAAAAHIAEKIHAERLADKFDKAAAYRGGQLAELLKTPKEIRAEEFRANFRVLDGGKPKTPQL